MSRLRRKWYVLYVRGRHEKQAKDWIDRMGFSTYLPLYKTLKHWSDRKKYVWEPLFQSYLFVNCNVRHIEKLIETPGFIKFIRFGGELAEIPDKQIKNVQKVLEGRYEIEINYDELKPGQPVRVLYGPLRGVEGELVKVKGTKKVAIYVDHVQQSLLVNVPADYLKLLPDPGVNSGASAESSVKT